MDWILLIQKLHHPPLDTLVYLFSFLGSHYCFMAIIPLVIWLGNRRKGIVFVVIFMMSMQLNSVLKQETARLRPFQENPEIKCIGHEPESYSFPSGHSQGAMILWASIAVIFPCALSQAFAAVVIPGVGLSRMYLGVHYPVDVAVGWAIGAVSVWLMVLVFRFMRCSDEFDESDGQNAKSCFPILPACLIMALSFWWMMAYPKEDVLLSGIILIIGILSEDLKIVRHSAPINLIFSLKRIAVGYIPMAIIFCCYLYLRPENPIHQTVWFVAFGLWLFVGAPAGFKLLKA